MSISQALGMSGASIVILLGGMIGADLAPTPALATLPISLMVVGVALFAIPAALLMRKFGRRAGFVGSSILAAGGASLAALAVYQGSYFLFCLSTVIIGANGAFAQQYRFAAIESVEPRRAGRAISFVLVGGMAAGYLGPEIATRTKDLAPFTEYAGPFFILALLYVVVAVLLSFLKDVVPHDEPSAGSESSFKQIVFRPVYLAALLSGVVAFGVMSFIMTATPLHLHLAHHYDLRQTASIIQSHIIAMYLPSLFTGFLLEKFGVRKVMMGGVFCMLGSVAFSLAGSDLVNFWVALVLLGVGWNFLFIGSTVLLTRSYHPSERFRAQATNDFTIFGVQAFTSLSAGTVLFYANWQVLQLTVLPFLLLVLFVIMKLHKQIEAPQVVAGY